MPVIINDIQDTNGSTDDISIPTGRDNYMLVLLSFAWDIDDDTPSRGTPSGGGGSWTAVSDQEVYVAFGNQPRIRAYAWYSYPTSRGDVTITTGSYSGAGDYTVIFSLSNAAYYAYDEIAQLESDQMFHTSLFSRQGSFSFGAAICLSPAGLIIGPVPDATLAEADAVLLWNDEGVIWGHMYTYYAQERGQRSGVDARRYVTSGVDWNEAVPTAGIQISVNTVECSIG